ncbi:unnamed protein product [Staurois parvus]|uniref:Plectin/eS10 N-terminal domain-containing protein n=1 Tax=Staurois parvus TaxID=386267 RepID=A0ABN9DAI9_9NEOB|nr:unnamed protein product [Staurois parvus]
MLMPRDRLRAIYEILFRDGVMVATNDERPQSRHAEVPGVTNLQVSKAMGSLKSRGFVRETFVWRHCYWYLTNEGIAYLRQYLHLPPEIVPASLQRVRRPVPPQGAPRRTPSANVQSVRGPTSYVPKPQGDVERQEYRRREQTVIQRGQNSTHGSATPHVVENSWQEGGWQRWADRDEQKGGTSYPSHAFNVLNGGEKWGSSRESQKWDEGRKSSVERTSLEITERRIAEKRLAETQGLRKPEVTSKQAVRAHADFLTALSPIASIHERRDERREETQARESEIIINSVTSTSRLQYAGNKPWPRLLQTQEEDKNLVVEKSNEHHVVPLVTRTPVSTPKTLETTNQQGENMEVKETSTVQKILEQEPRQGKSQSKKQKEKKPSRAEVVEAVQASGIMASLVESVKLEAKQEDKQKNDSQMMDHLDVQVTEAQVASNPEAVESQGEGSKQKNKKKREREISEIPSLVTSTATPLITKAKSDLQLEVKGQKEQKLAQEKISEKHKKQSSESNLRPKSEAKKEEPKSEAKKEEPKSEAKKEEPKRVRPRRKSPRVRPRRKSPRVRPRRKSPRVRPRRKSPRVRPRRKSPRVRPRRKSPRVRPRRKSPRVRPRRKSPRVRRKRKSPSPRVRRKRKSLRVRLKRKSPSQSVRLRRRSQSVRLRRKSLRVRL